MDVSSSPSPHRDRSKRRTDLDAGAADLIDLIPRLSCSVGSFELEPLEEGGGRERLGNVLHASLGAALREIACIRAGDEVCGDACEGGAACAVGALLEARPRPGATHLAGQSTVPNPLVVRPASPWFDSADVVCFDVVLLGRAAAYRDAVTAAVARAAAVGLGRRRIPYALAHLAWRVEEERPPAPHAADVPLRLELRTPLRLVRKGETLRSFSLPALVRDVARRAAVWAHHHLNEPWPAPPLALFEEAERLEILEERTRFVRPRRYSHRQGRTHPQDGLVGSVTLSPPSRELAALLRLAERTGAGKGTTCGLGTVAVATLADAAKEEA